MFQHAKESKSDLNDLMNQINQLKTKLLVIASKEGMNSIKTIMISQELDRYILRYQLYRK
ncbi:MAG TPA: aspartyl-phosphate phosphatase Spo0E family protein [Niallia sp.]|nr:aspartyl-phosphate phosphatase Spo0E family protein [Niallia sp.]